MNSFNKVALLSSAIGTVAYIKSDRKTKKKIKRDTKKIVKVAGGITEMF